MSNSNDGETPVISSQPVDQTNDIEKPKVDLYNPFNEKSLAMSQADLDRIMSTPVLSSVTVGRPGDQVFVRVCADPNYHLLAALISHAAERDTKYLVTQEFLPFLDKIKFHVEHLYLYVTRQNELGFWPIKVRTDNRENKWLASKEAAIERAMDYWVCVVSNPRLGRYETFDAMATIPDPDWPKLIQGRSLWQLLENAFGASRLIDREDHPLIQELRGAS
jgi:hypothetical protein